MINVVFIGNRDLILKSILKNSEINLVHAFIVGSLPFEGDNITCISSKGDKGILLSLLNDMNFDLCISAGCPYLLLERDIPKAVYVNCHPSPLPYGKGKHPINNAILSEESIAGASIHYLTDELDGGDILAQETFKVTRDLDVQLLYSVLFELENKLFEKVLDDFVLFGLDIDGIKQSNSGSYYSRPVNGVFLLASECTVNVMDDYLRAFSHSSQGVNIICNEKEFIGYSGREIYNDYFVNKYIELPYGDICSESESFVLLRLIDGIFRVDKL